MKNYNKTTTTTLVNRFDSELKMLLLNDLNRARSMKKGFLSNIQAPAATRLSVA